MGLLFPGKLRVLLSMMGISVREKDKPLFRICVAATFCGFPNTV